MERIGNGAALVARRLRLDPARCELIRLAAPLHDVGKIGISDEILLKSEGLTDAERTRMEEHAEIGYRLLTGSGSDLLETAATIAWSHHECWDGSGYPRRLVGEAIPIEGRITAVIDVFDALTHDRVYRPAMPLATALEMIRMGGALSSIRRSSTRSSTRSTSWWRLTMPRAAPRCDAALRVAAMDLRGKTVFITGAARGIGAESARRLAARRAPTWRSAGLEPEELERVARQCGTNAAWFECDVTDWDAIDRRRRGRGRALRRHRHGGGQRGHRAGGHDALDRSDARSSERSRSTCSACGERCGRACRR